MAKYRKGSKQAKAHMAKLRAMVGKGKRRSSSKKRSVRRVRKSPSLITTLTNRINAIRRQGRKVVKARHIKSKPFYFTGRRSGASQIILSEGAGMSRKRSRKHSRKGRRSYGFEGRRRSRRSRRGLLMGGKIGGGMRQVVPLLTQGAVGAVGAIGSAFVANKLPIANPKLKAGVPLALAILITMFGNKIPMSKPLAFGCAMSGILALTKQFVPAIPLLSGVDSAPELSSEEQLMLGAPQTFGATQEFMGAMSPADL